MSTPEQENPMEEAYLRTRLAGKIGEDLADTLSGQIKGVRDVFDDIMQTYDIPDDANKLLRRLFQVQFKLGMRSVEMFFEARGILPKGSIAKKL